jgi:protein-S-isoprenylcysteine O-methyltransferase Ste14
MARVIGNTAALDGRGIYGVVAGGIGWSLVTSSVLALVFAIGLALLVDAKARREEAWLIARHPAYRAYRTRTRRFIPGIY